MLLKISKRILALFLAVYSCGIIPAAALASNMDSNSADGVSGTTAAEGIEIILTADGDSGIAAAEGIEITLTPDGISGIAAAGEAETKFTTDGISGITTAEGVEITLTTDGIIAVPGSSERAKDSTAEEKENSTASEQDGNNSGQESANSEQKSTEPGQNDINPGQETTASAHDNTSSAPGAADPVQNTLPPTLEENLFPDYFPRNGSSDLPVPEEADIAESARTELEPLTGQKNDGVITILCCGVDDASMSTDTMIVGRIDTKAHTMNFVSIPRDLLINVPWDCRKLNSVYAGSKGGEEGINALLIQIKRLTGFDVDYYAFIDLFCFSWAIEALGGVWFDVPCEMSYADEAQDLYIDLQPGYQLLNSYEAMGLVRYRYTYQNGDIDRIELQHSFLKSVMSQLISARNIPNLPFLIRVARENMQTNLNSGNMAWLAFQLLRTDAEDIHFYTMPIDTVYLRDYSYALCRVWDWLPMVNETINPTDEEIGWGNVDIVYHNGEKYAGTQGYLAEDWYYDWHRN